MKYIPILILMIYIIMDTYNVRRDRLKIPLVIHVNGTRGKSTVVKMLDEVYRANGYRTFSKVTGTKPVYRDCQGVEHDVKRTVANVNEQKRILKRAAKDGADVLIIECMALRSEMQIYSEEILNADLAVITNVRTDHMEVMGETKAEIAKTLLKITRKGQKVFIGDEYLKEHVDGACDVTYSSSFAGIDGEHKDNTDLVLTLARESGLEMDLSMEALKEYQKDYGVFKELDLSGNKVFFAFAANDLESTEMLLQRYNEADESIYWFNNRSDRPMRCQMFLEWICLKQPDLVLLSGGRLKQNEKKLKTLGYKGRILSYDDFQGTGRHIFGFGNVRDLEKYFGEMNV